MWHGCVAKRGAIEVASCIEKYVQTLLVEKPQTKEVRLWSDNCSGQNKNKLLLCYYVWASRKYGFQITQRYMTKGHTVNEADCVHSVIEKRARHREFFCPKDYFELIRFAKLTRPFYSVVEMDKNHFFDYRPLLQMAKLEMDDKEKRFFISKVKEMVFIGLPTVQFKTDFNTDAETVKILK